MIVAFFAVSCQIRCRYLDAWSQFHFDGNTRQRELEELVDSRQQEFTLLLYKVTFQR